MRHAPANSERQLNFLPVLDERLEKSISRETGFALRDCGESPYLENSFGEKINRISRAFLGFSLGSGDSCAEYDLE